MIDEAICNALYILRKRSIETRDVRDQHRLVVLSAPREHRCHERNAEASTLIAEKVGEARRLVIFVLGQIGVGELAGRDKQEGDPEALKRACPGFFSVVGCKIETRELPHGAPDDGENKPKEKVVSVGKGKVALPEQPQFNYRVLLAQFPNHRHHQSDDRNGKECHDEVALKPVQPLAAIEHDFKAGEAERDQQNSQVVNLQSSCLACSLYFLLEFWRIRQQPTGQDQRDDSDWDINEEDPAPRKTVGDPATKRRSNSRGRHDRHAIKRKSSRTLGGRKRIYEDRLLDWGQASSGDALAHSEKDQ